LLDRTSRPVILQVKRHKSRCSATTSRAGRLTSALSPEHRADYKSMGVSLTVGLLSKMTTPWSRTGTVWVTADLRCVAHHHPMADPAMVAMIPRVRLLTETSVS